MNCGDSMTEMVLTPLNFYQQNVPMAIAKGSWKIRSGIRDSPKISHSHLVILSQDRF